MPVDLVNTMVVVAGTVALHFMLVCLLVLSTTGIQPHVTPIFYVPIYSSLRSSKVWEV